MSNFFEFVAEAREASGSSAARGVRRTGKVPAVMYGGGVEPEMLALDHNEVEKSLAHEAVYSHVLNVVVNGKAQKALLKAVQRHPARPQILHMDFMRIDATHKVKMHVPLHFINEDICVGVKAGGVATHAAVDVEVTCMPDVLPEYLEVDLAEIELGGVVHLSDVVLPVGVEIVELTHGDGHDHPVAQVVKSKAAKEDSESVDEESEEE